MSEHRCLNCETPHDFPEEAIECCACPHCEELQAKLDAVEEYYRILEAKLDAVKNCKRYRIFNSVLYEPDPDGRLMLAKDVLEAIGEQE